MGYIVRKNRGGRGWKLLSRQKRQETYIRDAAYPPGILPSFTLEEARAAVKRLNAGSRTQAGEAARTRASVRWHQRVETMSALFPPTQLMAFEHHLIQRYTKPERFIKQWHSALPLLRMGAGGFLSALRAKRLSPDYCDRLIRVANLWLTFTKQGVLVPLLRGSERDTQYELWHDKDASTEATPLTPEHLIKLKQELPPKQYAYMFITMWLGLRPIEMKRREYELKDNWLHVYQSKLTRVARHKRWKYIPLVEPEMKEAANMWDKEPCTPPLPKTLNRILNGEHFGRYSGRKGFTSLFLSKGYSLLDVSLWLGHQSVDRTLRNYYDRTKAPAWPKKA
jgi:hypothetical protein